MDCCRCVSKWLGNRLISASARLKLDPYMQPLFDHPEVIQNPFSESDTKNKKITELLEGQKPVYRRFRTYAAGAW